MNSMTMIKHNTYLRYKFACVSVVHFVILQPNGQRVHRETRLGQNTIRKTKQES